LGYEQLLTIYRAFWQFEVGNDTVVAHGCVMAQVTAENIVDAPQEQTCNDQQNHPRDRCCVFFRIGMLTQLRFIFTIVAHSNSPRRPALRGALAQQCLFI